MRTTIVRNAAGIRVLPRELGDESTNAWVAECVTDADSRRKNPAHYEFAETLTIEFEENDA